MIDRNIARERERGKSDIKTDRVIQLMMNQRSVNQRVCWCVDWIRLL